MEIPKTRKLSQAERFCEGIKLLANECGMSYITYTKIGSLYFSFDDGSEVGGLRAFKEAGLIKSL